MKEQMRAAWLALHVMQEQVSTAHEEAAKQGKDLERMYLQGKMDALKDALRVIEFASLHYKYLLNSFYGMPKSQYTDMAGDSEDGN